MRIGHLSKRFFGSLRPGGPPSDDVAWARSQMLPGERELWQQMSNADERHSIAVARRVERALGHEAGRPVLAAALLHDCGKIDADLGAYGRVVATLSVSIAGQVSRRGVDSTRGASRARSGSTRATPRSARTASRSPAAIPLTIAWTARAPSARRARGRIPHHLAIALKEVDDD